MPWFSLFVVVVAVAGVEAEGRARAASLVSTKQPRSVGDVSCLSIFVFDTSISFANKCPFLPPSWPALCTLPTPSLSSPPLPRSLQNLQIRQQALIALEEATAVVMIVDGQAGCNVLDQEIARFLRQQKVPVILAVNKCESEVRRRFCSSTHKGRGRPSCVHAHLWCQ